MATFAAVLAVLAAIGVYLSWTAGRIDRLHARVEGAAAALDAQLVRRSAAAVAAAGRAAPRHPGAAQYLAAAARLCQASEGISPDRAECENALSRALHEFVYATRGPLDPELSLAAHRLSLARRFYNDAVRDTLSLRQRWLPRVAHLAGRAPLPRYFDMDDSMPQGAGSAPDQDRLGLDSSTVESAL